MNSKILGIVNPQFILNSFKMTDIAVAYSLQRILISDKFWEPRCIRVRRDNDNVEKDIGYSNYKLDVSSLKMFVGANNGFVTTWYDPTGRGNHAVQATAGNQPQIVANGVILTDTNGNVAIKAISASDTVLSVPYNASFDISTNLTINAVHDPISTGGGGLGRLLSKNDTTDYGFYVASSDLMRMSATTASTSQAYATARVNISTVVVTNNANAKFTWQGNDAGTDASIQATATGNNPLCLFNRSTLGRGYDGFALEKIVFNRSLSDAEKNRLEYNQKIRYGVA